MFSLTKYYINRTIGHRYDYLPFMKYYEASDFPSLILETFEFKSEQDTTLKGFKYYYKDNNGKNVIFTHGMGAGHRSYLKEINSLCKMGYIVYSFDITGCGESDGENIRSFLQSLPDLHSFLAYYKKNISTDKVILIGHSWGGYASLNALDTDSDIIDKIVSISGFVTFKSLMKQYIGPLFPFAYGIIKRIEENLNKKYLNEDILNTLITTDKKILFIHSLDDDIVKYKYSTKLVKKIKNDNISYIIVDKKKHNPYLSDEGFKYYDKIMEKYNKLSKNMSLDDKIQYFKDVDWDKMTEEDTKIIKNIENFIKN